jgi:hypothetical protein
MQELANRRFILPQGIHTAFWLGFGKFAHILGRQQAEFAGGTAVEATACPKKTRHGKNSHYPRERAKLA